MKNMKHETKSIKKSICGGRTKLINQAGSLCPLPSCATRRLRRSALHTMGGACASITSPRVRATVGCDSWLVCVRRGACEASLTCEARLRTESAASP